MKDRQPDIRTVCDICKCEDCPRYADDCDGKDDGKDIEDD